MPVKRPRSRSANRRKVKTRFARASIHIPRNRRVVRSKRRSSSGLRVHRFTRYGGSAKTIQTTTEYDDTEVFTFNTIASYPEFSSLFDRYMITGVKVMFQLLTVPEDNYAIGSTSVANASNWYPKLWYCPDYDNDTAETVAMLKERIPTKCVILKPNKMVSVMVRPAILSQTYRTALTTGYSPAWNKWIDAANVDVPHYGLKYAIDLDGIGTATNFTVRIERKFYFTMKDPR